MEPQQKLEKIKKIVKRAHRRSKPARIVAVKGESGVGVIETKEQEEKRFQHNFMVYGLAIEEITKFLDIKMPGMPKIEEYTSEELDKMIEDIKEKDAKYEYRRYRGKKDNN